MPGAWTYVLMACFILLSAFFSMSEAAMLSVQRVRLRHMLDSRVPGAARVARMVEHPERLLPPILLGNNLVNTAAAALGTSAAIALIHDQGRALLVATVAVTVILLVFGEVVPKSLGARHAERLSVILAMPLQVTQTLLFPATFVLQRLAGAVANLFGGRGAVRAAVTEEEIKTMILVGREAGTVSSLEAEIMHRVLQFGDRRAREVMTPRPEIVAVRQGATMRDFLALYATHRHTRYPVFQGDVDNVVGVLSAGDVLSALARGGSLDDTASALMRRAAFVPETKHVNELFAEMRTARQPLVMVADEFGGLAGLVTMRRLVREVVGDTGDADGTSALEVVQTGADQFDVDASLAIGEINARLGLELPAGGYETLAGFVLEQLGRVPTGGDTLSFRGGRFQVTEMRGVRILRVRVTRGPRTETGAGNGPEPHDSGP